MARRTKPAAEARRDREDPIVSTSFKVPESLRTRLKVAAALERRDMSELVADALTAYLGRARHKGHE
jgi:hypothetical protein